ncbi:hypothetical protein ACFYY9_22105 [Streptomyces nigra]|uniref:hypothetical protein n=1 Tax=Streptomyces TaxID=1883 RepID=UPI0006E1D456|nr:MULTISPECIES: hypothetical protein [Streptomyces]
MKLKITRLTSAAIAVGVTALGTVVMTPGYAMAAAATQCSGTQHKEFDTIGSNLDVYITLCVHRSGDGYYNAYADVTWKDGGGGVSAGMEDLELNLRLERNDADYKNQNFGLKAVNGSSSGAVRATGAKFRSSTTGGWTADGHVKWDIQNDGAGGGTWSLGGSPSI